MNATYESSEVQSRDSRMLVGAVLHARHCSAKFGLGLLVGCPPFLTSKHNLQHDMI